MSEPAWHRAEEFERSGYEGWVWIVYKGRVVEAYRDHNYSYRFGKHSQNVYQSECISSVMQWPMPAAPTTEKIEQGNEVVELQVDDFVKLVADMRATQREYFRNRDRMVLAQSKRLEKSVDAFIDKQTAPELF